MTPHGPTSLIGSTGFVGGNLLRQVSFDETYHSANISAIQGRRFDLVVCAGIRVAKWWANQHPEEDRAQIDALLGLLPTIQARQFLLISTIDVYNEPRGVDERDDPAGKPNHAYGMHRLVAERFVRDHFEDPLIVRLPGLFGPGQTQWRLLFIGLASYALMFQVVALWAQIALFTGCATKGDDKYYVFPGHTFAMTRRPACLIA